MEEFYSPARVFAQSRNRRYRQLKMLAPILFLLVVVRILRMADVISNPILGFDYIYLAAVLLVTAVLLYTLIHWHCPLCHKNLWHLWNPKSCPKCGQFLRDQANSSRRPSVPVN